MKSAAAAESASAADFCNKSATIGVLDAKPLLLRSFWDASHQCGTFGYKVMSVWRRKNILPDKISTWRLLQLRRRWQQWKFHQIYCFAEKRVLRGQRGWVSNGKWTAGPPDDTPARSVWVGSCASWKVGFSPWLLATPFSSSALQSHWVPGSPKYLLQSGLQDQEDEV